MKHTISSFRCLTTLRAISNVLTLMVAVTTGREHGFYNGGHHGSDHYTSTIGVIPTQSTNKVGLVD